MKKIISVFIATLLFCSLMFCGGCSNGYKAVRRITFTTNGVEKTCSSYNQNEFYYPEEITEEEYNQAISNNNKRQKYYADSSQTHSLESILKKVKGKTTYEYVEPKLEGYWYYNTFNNDFSSGKYYYWKTEYKKTNYYFVYVKVVSDTILKIKDRNGEITYTVTSYKLTSF